MVPVFLSIEIGNLSMNKKSEFSMYNNAALLCKLRSFLLNGKTQIKNPVNY